jgi:aspartyl-tRNA(Asn)/glutamyl-tRNA(Gln) amidotransferase subunit A
VKDVFGIPGYDTFAGSPRPLPKGFTEAGWTVQQLLVQGSVIIGKTHTVEFAFGGLGTNPHYEMPANPWSPLIQRAPGGSTAGGGVSIYEGSALMAIGSDTAGSVRIPAAWTGTVGLKTTKGRWPTNGMVPLSQTLDTVGILTRTVDDMAFVFRAIDGEDIPSVSDPRDLKIGLCATLVNDGCSPGVVEVCQGALRRLEGRGCRLIEVEVPEFSRAWALFKKGGPVSAELSAFLYRELPDWLPTLDPNVSARIQDAQSLRAVEYLDRLDEMSKLHQSVMTKFDHVDILAFPTVANTPPRLQDVADPAVYSAQNVLALRNTSLVSYTGLCALSIPVGQDSAGMPVGLQLVAPPLCEARLLAAGLLCEQVFSADFASQPGPVQTCLRPLVGRSFRPGL